MSLRHSLDLIGMVRPEAGTTALQNEIMSERASSLGIAEQRVIKAVAALALAGADRDAPLAEARKTCGNISSSANSAASGAITM